MKHLGKIMILIAVLGVSACTDAGRFAAGAGGTGAGGAAGTYAPNTPGYFNNKVGDRVWFAVDQSTLSDAARATLTEQARWLMDNPEFTAIIEGHTDERGTREYNLALGARRASSAQEFLVAQGVAANRLRTVSFGKERPVALCSAESCYSQNRRAVSVVTAGAPS